MPLSVCVPQPIGSARSMRSDRYNPLNHPRRVLSGNGSIKLRIMEEKRYEDQNLSVESHRRRLLRLAFPETVCANKMSAVAGSSRKKSVSERCVRDLKFLFQVAYHLSSYTKKERRVWFISSLRSWKYDAPRPAGDASRCLRIPAKSSAFDVQNRKFDARVA